MLTCRTVQKNNEYAYIQLLPVVWIFPRPLGVICYDGCVRSEGHRKLLQGLVSHVFTAYLFGFDLF